MKKSCFHVRRGDLVVVVSGDQRGQEGKVLEVIAGKGRVLVEGVRLIKKHIRRSQDYPQGVILQREGPISVSNVRLRGGLGAAAE